MVEQLVPNWDASFERDRDSSLFLAHWCRSLPSGLVFLLPYSHWLKHHVGISSALFPLEFPGQLAGTVIHPFVRRGRF